MEYEIKKFDVKKVTLNLKKINKENGISLDSGIQLIINNMLIYNSLVENINVSQTKTLYLIYQMSSTIFKMLEKFGIYPDSKGIKEPTKESPLQKVIKKVDSK